MNDFAREINTKAFEERWILNSRLKDRFRYNFEIARKNFLQVLKKTKTSLSNKKVLDIGFGSGLIMFVFDKSCKLFGTEFSEHAIKTCSDFAKKRGYKDFEFIIPEQSEILPYQSDFFDVVTASHVVEHVEKDKLLISEIFRVLKPGGIMCIICPIDNKNDSVKLNEETLMNPLFLEKKHYHVRNYNKEAFVERFSHLDNNKLQIEYLNFDSEIWDWKVSLDPFRKKISNNFFGKILNQIIRILINVPLSLLPYKFLNYLNKFLAKKSYQPRQCTIAIRKL